MHAPPISRFRPGPPRLHLPGIPIVALAGVLIGLSIRAEAAARVLVLEAGPHARTNTLVSLPWTEAGSNGELRGPAGPPVPYQVSGGRIWFIEPGLARSGSRRYAIVPGPGDPPRCTAVVSGENVELRFGGRSVLRYLAGPGALPRPEIAPEFRRGGYLHPVVTPSGEPVTDDYPPNHLHQHGLWWSWTKTVFEGRSPDFWNMGLRTGRTDFEALESTESGPVFAAFRSRQGYTDLTAEPPRNALSESWTVRLLALGLPGPEFHAFDLESEQHCTTKSPLQLPKYHYGGFAFRGLWEWNGPTNVLYLDSLGATNRITANATRPRWFWMGGRPKSPSPGGPSVVGLAILGHPDNFRAPQPLRVHPTEPYTAWSPSQLGDWEIAPGDTYRSRYRIVTFDGPPDAELLNRLWDDYAEPPVGRVE